jgi:hypothetical protein
VQECGRARKATDDNIVRRILFACWVTKATNTHSEYVILIDFPLQQWLRERASVLYHTYIASPVFFAHKSLPSELPTEALAALESHYVAHARGLYIAHN